MPYTLAHPGFALILNKRKLGFLDATGLIVGSIVPDFDIIYRLTDIRNHLFDYSYIQVFLIILPMALLLSLYVHWIFYKLENKPLHVSTSKICTVLVSCLIGIVLHLLLDKISHFDAAEIVVAYDHQSDHTFKFYNRLYYFLLYGPSIILTLAGLLLFAHFFKKQYGEKGKVLIQKIQPGITLITTIMAFIFFLLFKTTTTRFDMEFLLDSSIIFLTASFLATLFIMPLLIITLPKVFLRNDG